MKNRICQLVAVAMLALLAAGCEEDIYNGNWLKVSTLNAKGRAGSAMFAIDNKAYLVGGYGYYYILTYFNSVWEFDSDDNSWSECDTLPGPPRRGAVGFSIDGKGYVVGGIGADGTFFSDVFEFDTEQPAGSKWRHLDSDPYPGGEFYNGLGFAINGYGYVGTGTNSSYGTNNEYYRFDPTKADGSRWSQLSFDNVKPAKRESGNVFVIDDKAYIIGGRHNNYRVKQFECFDGATEQMSIISEDMLEDYNLDILFRYQASTFAIGNKGYLTCGVKFTGEVLHDTWEYTPNSGKGVWQKIANFEGPSRHCAPCVTLNGRGYMFCGQNGIGSDTFFDDVWYFDPNQEYDKKSYR